SPGTWSASVDLGPGDTYLVNTYSPHPSPAELAATSGPYLAEALVGYRSIGLPAPLTRPYAKPEIVFPPFHSSAPVDSVNGQLPGGGTGLIMSSPSPGAYTLSLLLAVDASTPLG